MNIKNKGYLFFFFLGILLFFLSYRQYSHIEDRKNQISIRYKESQVTAKMVERYYENCREKLNTKILSDPSVPNVTLWNKLEGLKASSGDYYSEDGYTLIEGYGDLEKILPGRLMNGGYPGKNDTSGCAVSKAGAEALFGSSKVLGKEVTIQKKTYIIRAVIDFNEKYLWIQNPDASGFRNAELYYRGMPPQASDGTDWMMQIGAHTQAVFTWNVYRAFHRFFLFLPIWVLWIVSIRWCSAKMKRIKSNKTRAAARVIMFFLTAAATAAMLRLCFTFGIDYIPASWSDFTFYQNKWKMLEETRKAVQSLPYFPQDAQMLKYSRSATLLSLGSAVCMIVSAAAKKMNDLSTKEDADPM